MTRIMAIVVCVWAYGIACTSAYAEDVFSDPLITGASVSAGYATPSPGYRVSLRHTTPERILTVAQGGATSKEIVPLLSEDMIASHSIVIGIDLFFWDATLANAEQSLRNLSWIIDTSRKASVPLVLGTIPSLLPGMQPQQDLLNRALREGCQPNLKCYLLDLDAFYNKIQEDGFLEINGRRYKMADLIPDGLHLSDVASEYLADQIEALVARVL